MGSDELAEAWVHTVTVRTYLGTTGSGTRSYADPVVVPCFLTRRQRLIRDASGAQVVASATVSADVKYADTFAPQSLVSADGLAETTVMQRDVSKGGTFVDGLDHVRAYLQ